jgi:hypothetical protein
MRKKGRAPPGRTQSATTPHAAEALEGPNDRRTVTGFLALLLGMFALTGLIIVLAAILPEWTHKVAMTPHEIGLLEQRIKPLGRVAVGPPQPSNQQQPPGESRPAPGVAPS